MSRRLIDYSLARRMVVRDVQKGRVTRETVCDAHPELVRAARNVGEQTSVDCPICERAKLRQVSYVFGDGLKHANGRCITSDAELERLESAVDELACYVVEVCTECSWNHLVRSFLMGRGHAG